MASEADLYGALRGVPVFARAAAIDTNRNSWPRVIVLDGGEQSTDADPLCLVSQWPFVDRYEIRRSALLLDLEYPDTRAAYDRRLALALGAPEELVNIGVMVWRTFGLVTVAAGPQRYDDDWRRDIKIDGSVTCPLLARALAWPADKRVAG